MSAVANYLDLDNSNPFIACDAWCQTEHVDVECPSPYTFVWTIKKFSSRKAWGCGDSIVSTVFDIPVPNSENLITKWSLKLESDSDSDFLVLQIKNCSEVEVKAMYECSILDENKQQRNVSLSNQAILFGSSNGFSLFGSSPRSLKRFVDRKKLTGEMLPNDCLHIVCELTVIGFQNSVVGKKISEESDADIKPTEQQLSLDLEEAFLKNECSDSDVAIKCKDKVTRCHKFILRARSPVFDAMFKADMKENTTGVVAIDNLDPRVVTSLLHFIYTGKTPFIDEFAKDLLAAANQYQLEQLKSICEEKLCQTLTSNNCLEFLLLAEVYSCPSLKKCSLELAAKNLGILMKSSEWKEELSHHPSLRDEVIEIVLSLKNIDAKK